MYLKQIVFLFRCFFWIGTYDWLVKFTNHGIKGLMDKPIPGRPKKLKIEHEKDIKEVLKKSS